MDGKLELTSADRVRSRLVATLLTLALLAPACVLAKLPDPVQFGIAVEAGNIKAVRA